MSKANEINELKNGNWRFESGSFNCGDEYKGFPSNDYYHTYHFDYFTVNFQTPFKAPPIVMYSVTVLKTDIKTFYGYVTSYYDLNTRGFNFVCGEWRGSVIYNIEEQFVLQSQTMLDDDDTLPTISGHDVIMAYGSQQCILADHRKESPRHCTRYFWIRYSLFVLNFLVWSAGVAMIGLGTWALVNRSGLGLFETLLYDPTWLLIGTGIVMVAVGVFGCAGALRLNIICIRVFMVLVICVFVLQLVLAAVVFFLMDHIYVKMLDVVKGAVTNYERDLDVDRDLVLESLQREFQCCGGSSYSDWDANRYYNCNSAAPPSRCGVPSSCCVNSRQEDCGFGIRDKTDDVINVTIHTEGCIVVVMRLIKENIIGIAALAFSVCVVEIACLILANAVSKFIVVHRKLLS
ncbi:Tetraspanin-14 [Bulinus truncatus]|nr:Tetraspanin-14 [Bulinus truncatus]